ncbi:hypothetical protein BGX29_004523 [Mortierella sp. GBA35]|nr:hypothetical protein BGX29_004523 [Mortierella sp. GBA35]
MSPSLLILPTGDESLEFIGTTPSLDPKIPFFKYLDMLNIISNSALSFHQQAYEMFMALNPHFSYASVSVLAQPVKLNKKIETLLKSSMILLRRYCLIQVSLPRLPSFRRRTHGSSLKAYETRAVHYREILEQYFEDGALLYLQACVVRSAQQQDRSYSESVQGSGNAPSSDEQRGDKSPQPTEPLPAKSTDRVSESSHPLTATRSVTQEQLPKDQKDLATAESTLPSPPAAPSRRSIRRKNKKQEAEIQAEVEEPSSTIADTPPEDSDPAAVALWRLERDLEKLKKAGALMEEQIAQFAHIRSATKLTPAASTPTPTVVSPLPVRSTAAHSILSRPSTAGTTATELSKPAKAGTVIAPVVTLTTPTPVTVSPSTSPKPVLSRYALSPANGAKSTTTKPKPVVSAKTGSTGTSVVRNLIRQYETPSGSSSSSTATAMVPAPPSKPILPDLGNKQKDLSHSSASVKSRFVEDPRVREDKIKDSDVSTISTSHRPIVSTTINLPVSSGFSSLSKARSAVAKSVQILEAYQGSSSVTGQMRDAPLKSNGDLTASGKASSIPSRHGSKMTTPSSQINNATQQDKQLKHSTSTLSLTEIHSNGGNRIQRSNTDGATLSSLPSSCPDPLPRSSVTRMVTSGPSTQDAGFQVRPDTGKQSSSLEVPLQGFQSRTRTSIDTSDSRAHSPAHISQVQTMSSVSMDSLTSTSAANRAGPKYKLAVALRSVAFDPSDPTIEQRSPPQISPSSRSSPKSTSTNAISSDESIQTWRRSIPPVVAAGLHSPVDSLGQLLNDNQPNSPVGEPFADQLAVNWSHEGDYEDNDEVDDGKSHVDLIRVLTMSSIRSSATANTNRTRSFSASSPLGSARFKRHQRSDGNLRSTGSNVPVQEKNKEVVREVAEVKKKEKELVQETKDVRKKPAYIPETDDSDVDTATLQYLEVPPAKGTQAWLDLRLLEAEQVRQKQQQEEDAGGSDYSLEDPSDTSRLERRRHDSKYSTMRIINKDSRGQTTSSRPQLSQVRFDAYVPPPQPSQVQDSTRVVGAFSSTRREGKQELQEIFRKTNVPLFTKPFKPDPHRMVRHASFDNTRVSFPQEGSRPLRHYASTISSSSTCSIRQPALSHSVSPASSAFASLRATPSSSLAPSVKSFATGSTVTLKTPKFFPPSTTSVNVVQLPYTGQHGRDQEEEMDSATASRSLSVRRIRAREARVLGSLPETVLGSRSRQMDVQNAAAIVRNGSRSAYHGHQQQHQQEQQDPRKN